MTLQVLDSLTDLRFTLSEFEYTTLSLLFHKNYTYNGVYVPSYPEGPT